MAFVTAPDFGIKSIQWELDRPAQVNVSGWTGRRTVVADPWHGKWRARVELASVQGEENVRVLRSFLARCRGSINTFRLYATAGAQNANTGVSVASTAAAGATAMTISGAATPLTDGQMFTVTGQLCCCTADQSGSTLTFEPPLREAATAGKEVHTDRPYALVHMASARLGYGIETWRRFGISFDVEEAILEPEPLDIVALFAGTAGGFWDPSDLTSVWQDSARTTPGAVDSPIGALDDLSGNGNHLLQATASKRPILRQAAGLYYAEGDGVDDALAVVGATAFDDCLCLMAMRAASGITAFNVTTGTGNGSAILWGSAGVKIVSANTAQDTTTLSDAFGATDYVLGAEVDGSTDGGTFHVNAGTEAASIAAGAGISTLKNLAVLANDSGGANAVAGRFYGGILLGRLPSASETAQVKTVLGNLAGLSL